MTSFILWYLAITLLGWLTLPLANRLLRGLPDRGYTASRVLGWLLWSYFFWLPASLGILRNEAGGLLFSLFVLAVLAAWAMRGDARKEFRGWLRAHSRLIVVGEILFLLAFALWAAVRAANPEAVGTEKPMELAFINAILHSPSFPPHDPWLSGYAISYYYFGYVMVAMLAKLTGVSGGVAFNLGISLVFALSALGAFGLAYNLLEAYRRSKNSDTRRSTTGSMAASLFAPLFLLIVSNLEGFLHSLHNRGLFWQRGSAGALTSRFWTWLDIEDLNLPPQEPFSWIPSRFWWWWRASRVVRDYDLAGNTKEIINEFPFFSFLLADLHPHVLAMPFAFLAMTLALNLFLGGARGSLFKSPLRVNRRSLAWIGTMGIPFGILAIGNGLMRLSLIWTGIGIMLLTLALFILVRMRQTLYEHGIAVYTRSNLGEVCLDNPIQIDPASFLLAALALGGLAFLNTWDFPFYVGLFAAAYMLEKLTVERKRLFEALKGFFWIGAALGVSGIFLYLPFYLGFASQVGGVLPSLIYPTRGAHLWVMFAPLLLPVLAFLAYQYHQKPDPTALRKSFQLVLALFLVLFILSLLLGLAIVLVPGVRDLFLGALAAPGGRELIVASFTRRLSSSGGWLTLLILLAFTLSFLMRLDQGIADEPRDEEAIEKIQSMPIATPQSFPLAHYFVFLLILWGALLVTGPEFFYLRDQFGWRINTIFKFYFQAWLLWSVPAAYASALLLKELRGGWNVAFSLGLAVLMLMSLVYPTLSLWNKTNGFNPTEWTLDGTAYLERQSPDLMAAVRWLQSAQPGVVAEAVAPGGGSYTEYGRLSMLSGQPAVLGWVGHESQWRGGGQEMGSRQGDLERLYCSREWQEAQQILQLYNIRYIFIGPLERATYQPNAGSCPIGLMENKFKLNLKSAFQQGDVTIYEYTGPLADSKGP